MAAGWTSTLPWTQSVERRPERGLQHLHRELILPASLENVFAFFADARNLERLTPPWLRFTIRTTPPIIMRAGAEIDYTLRLYGVPIPWRSRIDVWEPGVRFVDRQIVGPYRWWNHDHRFEVVPEGIKVIDHVDYVARAAWASQRLVERDLERIFRYRQQTLRQVFAMTAPSAAPGGHR